MNFSAAFQLYKLAGDAHLYLYDLVNSRQIVTIAPAASTSTVAIAGNATVTGAADAVQLVVQANGTQTHHLQDWSNSSGSPVAYIAPTGGFTASVTSGNAVSGYTANTSGTAYGVLGEATGSSSGANVGIYGQASGSSAQTWVGSL